MLRFGLSISALVFVVDQISKWIVLGPARFSPPGCLEAGYGCRFIELSPIFDLQMVWNRGVSFGLLRANEDLARWGLVALSFVISGVFLWWLKGAERKLTAVALGLVIGGALGNVVDRIRFGAVADFLDFNGLWFPWVFNVADAAITVGAILLAVDMIFLTESEPGKGAAWGQIKTWWRRVRGGSGGTGG
ncbi:MAG: signal peptidase II [Hyphomonadaceae bacterium]|nr:signal peptidase II [Hyphomonadaceae bacterium]GIK47663.1 MAG: lipoprotein signal peptidase [Alphaproteobacteria bacterium]